MRILLLGTSNSLLQGGWVSGLAEALPDAEIFNLSLGRSPGLQFASRLGAQLDGYDVVFVDSLANDEQYEKWLGAAEHADRIAYEILSTISARSRLVVLGFCMRKHAEGFSSTYHRRKEMTRACGGQFVGVVETLRSFQDCLVPDSEDLFADDMHPNTVGCFRFGFSLGTVLPEFVSTQPARADTEDFAHAFGVFDLCTDAPVERQIVRRTRLVQETFRLIENGETCELPQFGSGQLRWLGLYVSRFESNARLVFEGAARTGMNLRFADPTQAFEMNFFPVANGPQAVRLLVEPLPANVPNTAPPDMPVRLVASRLVYRLEEEKGVGPLFSDRDHNADMLQELMWQRLILDGRPPAP